MRGSRAIGITGTPGTGKKTISSLLAPLLDMSVLNINELAKSLAPARSGGELSVDAKKLRSTILKTDLSKRIVSGHLLPDVLEDGELEFVAVLRCEPMTLRTRLAARGYPSTKMVENLEAELIGVILDGTLRAFGRARVHEYDTTRAKPPSIAERIAKDYRSRVIQKSPWIDWTLTYDSTRLRSLLSPVRTEPAST